MRYALFTMLFINLGCATIIQSGPDRIPVSSAPEGAKISLDGVIVGKTPMVVDVPRHSDGIFRIESEGFEPVTIDRDKVMSGWIWGNLILGGGFGIIIDLITSNQGHYQSEPISVNMTAIRNPANSKTEK